MKKVLFTLSLVASSIVAFAGPVSVSNLRSNEMESTVLSLDPVFKRKGDKLILNFLNSDQVMVEIRVLDSQNNLVYSERIPGNLIIEKAFDFSKAYEDSYTVVVAYNQNAFEHVVKVQ